MKKNTILGYAVVAMMWAGPSKVIDHYVGPLEATWFFVGGISIILLALVFTGFKGGEDGS